jgi:RNA polymerase sigma factor (sigma-70 family)
MKGRRMAGQDEFIPTRRSLLSRLKNWDDQESWRVFFDTYWRLLYGVALKAGLSEAEAQDVVQEAVMSVAKQMRGFRYDPAVGSFKGWLRLITRRRIADHFRKRGRDAVGHVHRSDRTATGTGTIERLPGPESFNLDTVWDEEWEKAIMDAAIRHVKQQVAPKQYQIFDCYVLKSWPVAKVRSDLGVSLAQVYLAKHRVSRLIRKEVARLQTQMF